MTTPPPLPPDLHRAFRERTRTARHLNRYRRATAALAVLCVGLASFFLLRPPSPTPAPEVVKVLRTDTLRLTTTDTLYRDRVEIAYHTRRVTDTVYLPGPEVIRYVKEERPAPPGRRSVSQAEQVVRWPEVSSPPLLDGSK